MHEVILDEGLHAADQLQSNKLSKRKPVELTAGACEEAADNFRIWTQLVLRHMPPDTLDTELP